MAEAKPSGPTPGTAQPAPAAQGATGPTGASGASGATGSSGGNGSSNDPPEIGTQIADTLAKNPPPGWSVLVAFAIIVVGLIGVYILWRCRRPSDFMPSSNYAIYAGLFIMALALERLLEPFSGWFFIKADDQKAKSVASQAHAKRVTQAHVLKTPLHAAASSPPNMDQVAAAQKAATAETKKAHVLQSKRAVLMWAVATLLAMLSCAALGIFLLRSVETTTTTGKAAPSKGHASLPTPAKDPNRVLDLLATGLVVGAGTKPLHDLITQIQTSSSNAKSSGNSSTAS